MKKRILLGGSENTRFSASAGAVAASGVVGVGVVGIMVVGAGGNPTDKDQKFLNCFPMTVTNPLTGKVTLYVVKRPGWASYSTPAAGSIGTAVHAWSGSAASDKIISAFGATNSTIYDGTTSLGAITGTAAGITETFVSTTPTLLISSSDNTAWYYDTTVPTKVTDAQFPGNASKTLAGTFAHMDGYAFIMDTEGTLCNSDLNTVTSWTALGYISTNSYPDKGVGCIRHRNTIVAFGRQSMEVFRNAGNATGSPLTRIEEATQQIGAMNSNSIGSVNDVLVWVGTSRTGDIGVYLYDGGTPVRVSTASIEAQISILGGANVRLQTVRFYGRSFIVVMGNLSTYVYSIEDKAWHEWSSQTMLWQSTDGQANGSSVVTLAVSNVSTSGKLFVINPASLTFLDNGVSIATSIRTSGVDFDTNDNKRCDAIEIIGDTETSTSPTTISWTDDDYQTYSNPKNTDLSYARKRVARCGSFRRRAFVISNTANTPMRIEALELDIS